MSRFSIYAAIALVAGVAGFVVYQQAAKTPPAATVVQQPGRIPDVLPTFSLMNREGTVQSIQDWPGRSLIVNFWATWCAPCRREIPLLNEIHRTRAAQGFQIVGVAVDFRDDVLKYASTIGIDYPLLIGEQDGIDAVNAFGVQAIGFPFTAFTDSRGRIVTLHIGELTAPEAGVILDTVLRVNSGELTPAAARTAVAMGLAKLPRTPEKAS